MDATRRRASEYAAVIWRVCTSLFSTQLPEKAKSTIHHRCLEAKRVGGLSPALGV